MCMIANSRTYSLDRRFQELRFEVCNVALFTTLKVSVQS